MRRRSSSSLRARMAKVNGTDPMDKMKLPIVLAGSLGKGALRGAGVWTFSVRGVRCGVRDARRCRMQGAGFMQGTGCGVQGSGFSVERSAFSVQGSGFSVQLLGRGVQGSTGSGLRVQRSAAGSGFRISG